MSWITKEWTTGQLNALVEELGGEDVARGILDRTMRFIVIEQVAEQGYCLRFRDKVRISGAARDLNRTGIWLSDAFRMHILSVMKAVENMPEMVFAAYNFAKPANDEEIRRELPEGHVFEDASEFCMILSAMLERQKKGEAGVFLVNGRENIFYVRGKAGEDVFAVLICWAADVRKWSVSAFLPGNYCYPMRRRVFSCSF